ncbi:hypothetical protein C7U61_04300 [Rhizobium sp. JAB6]|nr:hypothetical protein C7U61_04300 [Rhizobium sp. JAB6]
MGEIAKSGKWQALKILSNLEIILENKSNKSRERGEPRLGPGQGAVGDRAIESLVKHRCRGNAQPSILSYL